MTTRWVSLKDVLRPDPLPVAVAAGVEYPSAGLLNRGRGLFRKSDVAGEATSYKTLYRLAEGQVVYSKLFGWEGSLAVVPHEFAGLHVSSEFPTFAVDGTIVSPRFLDQYLRSSKFMTAIASATTGLGQRRQRVNPESFLSLPLPLPSSEEQDRIAVHLDSLERSQASLGSTTHLNAMRSQVVEVAARRASYYPLGSLVQLERRQIVVRADQAYREIGVRSFGKGIFVKEPIVGADLGAKRVFEICANDLVVSNVFAWEGAVGLAGTEHVGLVGSHRFMTWTARTPALDIRYLYEYLRTPQGRIALAAASPGSAGRNRTLAIENFKKIEVPVPDGRAQEHVKRVGVQLDQIRDLTAKRDALRAAVVPAARNEIFVGMA